MLAARREKLLKAVVEEFSKKGDLNYYVTDATIESSVKDLIDFTIKTYNRIDIAVYCCGISQHSSFENIKDINKVYKIIMDVNFTGLVYFTHHCQDQLKKK